MLRSTRFRTLLILPLVLASLMAVASAQAPANPYVGSLNTILKGYAGQEGTTTAAVFSRTTITASGDDLVSAVYDFLCQPANSTLTAQQAADVAAAALLADGANKVRADKDKVAARVLEAVIVARGSRGTVEDTALVDALLVTLGAVNNNLPAAKQLTAAGKEAIVAKAIRATSNLGPTIGATIAVRSNALALAAAGTTPNAKRNTFTLAVLKLLTFKPQVYDPALASTSAATEATKGQLVQLYNGVPEGVTGNPPFDSHGVPPGIAAVRNYVNALLGLYDPALADQTAKNTAAYTLAEGVASNPSVAGAVIGGLVQNKIATDGASAATDTAIVGLVNTAARRTKLATAIADIVFNGFSQLNGSDKTLPTGTILFNQTPANKGKIASGAIRSAPTQVAGILNFALSETIGHVNEVTQSGLAAFATAAATGNGDNGTAAVIATTIIGKLDPKPTAAADLTAIQTIAINVIKAVAPANPDAAGEVAIALFGVQRTIGGVTFNPYSDNDKRTQLAADLAKGAATNYTAAGAAVAGVVKQSIVLDSMTATPTANLDVKISAAAIKVAAKAAVSIAQKVSATRTYSGASANAFASALALSVPSTSAGAIAAGVALTDTAHAGDIVVAVICSNNAPLANQNAALNKAALTIASTAAINLDVEAIADIAQKVGTLFQPKTGAQNANLPKISTIGTLATSLAKAINTKPLVRQKNRVDELGELAAVLVTASLKVTGGNTAAALAAIGTNIYKAASAKLLADAGNNAADLKDIAGDIAGAIAQTIAHAPLAGPGALTAAEKTKLLTDTGTGTLIKLLSTAAKTFAAQVNTTDPAALLPGAFNLVRATETLVPGVYGFVAGNEAIGTNGSATPLLFSKFEIGAVVDSETPVKNL